MFTNIKYQINTNGVFKKMLNTSTKTSLPAWNYSLDSLYDYVFLKEFNQTPKPSYNEFYVMHRNGESICLNQKM